MSLRTKIFILLALTLLPGCGGGKSRPAATLLAAAPPREYTYRIVATYPHAPTSYTQGLLWSEGALWESTGQYGQSAVMRVDLQTGRALQRKEIGSQYFGEGLALLDSRLWLLTWQEKTALVYDAATLEQTGSFTYSGEGWGLTTDGEMLYMSDGTESIQVIDPKDFTRKRTIHVYTDRGPLQYLNELEWVEGEIWANVYTTMAIARIDPETGNVLGIIDLTGILPQEEITRQTDVLNGIAYDPAAKRIFVTGKNWPKLFEIEVIEKN